MGTDFDLVAENSDLAGMTRDFRTALREFIEKTGEEVAVMNDAFANNGMTGSDDLVTTNNNAFLENVRKISASLQKLGELDERLSDKEKEYQAVIDRFWEGTT